MKNVWILGLMILSLFSMKRAHSSILLEPYIGSHFFGSERTVGSDVDKLSGMAFGARVGFQTLGFMAGVNYKTGSFSVDDATSDIDSYTNMGAFIGYEFPILIRVWGEYVFSSTLDFEGGGELEKGNGTTLGVGYTGLPFISINLEMSTVDGYETSAGTSSIAEFKTTFLSVSFPFTL